MAMAAKTMTRAMAKPRHGMETAAMNMAIAIEVTLLPVQLRARLVLTATVEMCST